MRVDPFLFNNTELIFISMKYKKYINLLCTRSINELHKYNNTKQSVLILGIVKMALKFENAPYFIRKKGTLSTSNSSLCTFFGTMCVKILNIMSLFFITFCKIIDATLKQRIFMYARIWFTIKNNKMRTYNTRNNLIFWFMITEALVLPILHSETLSIQKCNFPVNF